MSKELIERLRNLAEVFGGKCAEDVVEAAERIEELERERDLHYNRVASLLFSDLLRPDVTAGMIQCWLLQYVDAGKERDALLADNARLREAISYSGAYKTCQELADSLAATPEQSLARIRNQVRDECYNALQKVMVTDHSLRTYKRCLDAISAMKEQP